MFRFNKLILTTLTIFMVTVLTACNLGQAAAPTPTAVDINAIMTNVAATVQAQLTVDAPTITPTFTVTETPTTAVATNTQGVVVEQTTGATVTATLSFDGMTATPSATLFGGITATPSVTPIGGLIAIPSFTPVAVVSGGTAGPLCDNSSFQGDVTINDNTEMKAWDKFEKVWSIKNTGICRWDEGYYFAPTDGPPSMAKSQAYQGKHKFEYKERFVEPGATVSISIDMYAPGEPGTYVAHWHLFNDKGQAFGSDFTVVIVVVK